MRDVVYRKLRGTDRLRKLRPVPVSVITKGLYPVLLATCCFLRFRQPIARIVFEGLCKARRRDRRRLCNIPDVPFSPYS